MRVYIHMYTFILYMYVNMYILYMHAMYMLFFTVELWQMEADAVQFYRYKIVGTGV